MSSRERKFLAAWIIVVSVALSWHLWYTDRNLLKLYNRTEFLLFTHNMHLMNEHGVRPDVEREQPDEEVPDPSNYDLYVNLNH